MAFLALKESHLFKCT